MDTSYEPGVVHPPSVNYPLFPPVFAISINGFLKGLSRRIICYPNSPQVELTVNSPTFEATRWVVTHIDALKTLSAHIARYHGDGTAFEIVVPFGMPAAIMDKILAHLYRPNDAWFYDPTNEPKANSSPKRAQVLLHTYITLSCLRNNHNDSLANTILWELAATMKLWEQCTVPNHIEIFCRFLEILYPTEDTPPAQVQISSRRKVNTLPSSISRVSNRVSYQLHVARGKNAAWANSEKIAEEVTETTHIMSIEQEKHVKIMMAQFYLMGWNTRFAGNKLYHKIARQRQLWRWDVAKMDRAMAGGRPLENHRISSVYMGAVRPYTFSNTSCIADRIESGPEEGSESATDSSSRSRMSRALSWKSFRQRITQRSSLALAIKDLLERYDSEQNKD